MNTMKRLARMARHALMGSLYVAAVLAMLAGCTFLFAPNVWAQTINVVSRGPVGVGSLFLGYGQGANGVGQDINMRTGAGAPTNGVTGVNVAPPMSLYFDVTNFNIWQNTGTKAVPSWQPVVGDDAVRYATVTLTNAQILALGTTPVTVVAAPGAGKTIEPIGGTVTFTSVTTAYTLNSNNIALYWGRRETGNRASNAILAAGLLDQVTTGLVAMFGAAPNDTDLSTTQQPVVIMNTLGSAMTGGNAANTLKVNLAYRIRTY